MFFKGLDTTRAYVPMGVLRNGRNTANFATPGVGLLNASSDRFEPALHVSVFPGPVAKQMNKDKVTLLWMDKIHFAPPKRS